MGGFSSKTRIHDAATGQPVVLSRERCASHFAGASHCSRRLSLCLPKHELNARGVYAHSCHKFHVYLSHIWGTGAAQVATIKQQLRPLIAGIKVFRDRDNLENISMLEQYIDESAVMLLLPMLTLPPT